MRDTSSNLTLCRAHKLTAHERFRGMVEVGNRNLDLALGTKTRYPLIRHGGNGSTDMARARHLPHVHAALWSRVYCAYRARRPNAKSCI